MMSICKGNFGTTLLLPVALVLATTASGQGFQTPKFAGTDGTELLIWDNFAVGFGGPNTPDVVGSTGNGVLTQSIPGGTVTGSGNIYNPAGASRFTIADSVEGDYEQVVLQVESIGDVDASAATLSYGDETITVAGEELGRVAGGFGDTVYTLFSWDLTGVETSEIEIGFSAVAAHMSLAVVRLDTLSEGIPSGETIEASWSTPAHDRWNYSFNVSPGSRSKASVFRAVEEGVGITRHGTYILRFETSNMIPAGLPPAAYQVEAMRLELLTSNGFEVAYDPTYDSALTHLPTDHEDAEQDADPGRPIQLFGALFRQGIDPADWTETEAYSGGDDGETTVLPGILNEEGVLVSAHLGVDFVNPVESSPLAVGHMDGVEEGQMIPEEAPMFFDVDPADALAVAYLQQGFSVGYIDLVVTSLNGGGQGVRTFPEFHTADSLLGEPPALTATVTVVEVAPDPVAISSIRFDDARVTLEFTDFLEGQERLEWSDDLVSWTTVEQPIVEPLAGGGVAWVDPDASGSMRFYRVSEQ